LHSTLVQKQNGLSNSLGCHFCKWFGWLEVKNVRDFEILKRTNLDILWIF
jgi:hypothetical protein